MQDRINAFLEDLLDAAHMISIPFFMKQQKKKELLLDKKRKLDDSLLSELTDAGINITDLPSQLELFWTEAAEETELEFENIKENLRLSSFYFQEIFSRYIEKIRTFLLAEETESIDSEKEESIDGPRG